MKELSVYQVTFNGDGWSVRREGGITDLSSHHTKTAAVFHGRVTAATDSPSILKVYFANGRLEREDAFLERPPATWWSVV
jgi:hypothetical protein